MQVYMPHWVLEQGESRDNLSSGICGGHRLCLIPIGGFLLGGFLSHLCSSDPLNGLNSPGV